MFYIKVLFRTVLYIVITTIFLSYIDIHMTFTGIIIITIPLFIHAYRTEETIK